MGMSMGDADEIIPLRFAQGFGSLAQDDTIRSGHTEELAASRPSLTADISTRLQQIVVGWQGAERNQPLPDLHNECLNAAGPGGRPLLPVRLLLVKELDETHLQAALRGLNGKGRGTQLRFHVKSLGGFDAALVPTGPVGEAPNQRASALAARFLRRSRTAADRSTVSDTGRGQRSQQHLWEMDHRENGAGHSPDNIPREGEETLTDGAGI